MTDTASDVSDVSATSTNNSGTKQRGSGARKHSRRQSSISEKYDMVKNAATHWRKGSGGSSGGGVGSLDFSSSFLPGMGLSDEADQPTADEEISTMAKVKEKLDRFWNEHIDIEENGDCDVDEWVMRLKALNVQLTDKQMRAFFDRMDDGQATFLDKNEFLQFMNHTWNTEELISYQNAIYDKIDGAEPRNMAGGKRGSSNQHLDPSSAGHMDGSKAANDGSQSENKDNNDNNNEDDAANGHERKHSNLVTGDDEDVDEVQLHLMKQQLARELKRQNTKHYQKLSVAESLLAAIDNEEKENPDRFDEANIRNWGPHEVTAWVVKNFNDINIEQVPALVRKQGWTGTNLLYDVDEATLRTVGFTPTQARDGMRYIEELRDAHSTLLQESTQEQIQQMSIIFEPGPEVSPEASPEPLEAAERLDGLDPLTVTIPEIRRALAKHTASYANIKPNAVKEFLQTLELLKSKSKNFCVKTRDAVKKWTREEVAYWAKDNGFEKYCYAFFINDVTGSMLIQDLTKDALVKDIGTSNIHASSILRTIKELQEYVLNFRNDPNYKENSIEINVYGNDLYFESEFANVIENETKEMEETIRQLEDDLREKDEQLKEATEKLMEMETRNEENGNENENESENENDLENGDDNDRVTESKAQEMMEPVKNYQEMSLEDLELELEMQKAKVAEIEQLIKDKTPKSEDTQMMEAEMDAAFNGNLDALPTASQARGWNNVEVGAWMRNVVRLPEYIGHIYKMKVDGDMLLEDWYSKEEIKRLLDLDKDLHVNIIFREVNKLKDACGIDSNADNGIRAGKGAEKPLEQMNMKELRDKAYDLMQDSKSNKEMMDEMEKNCDNLGKEIEKLKETQTSFVEKITKLEGEKQSLQETDAALKSELAHLHDVKVENKHLKQSLTAIETSKCDTIHDLCREMDTLRTASRIMSKQIIYLQEALRNSGFRPMESFLTYMGYEKSTRN